MSEAIENTFDHKIFLNERKHRKGYREWTAKHRTAPSIFIIGAQKAGTTSLLQYLVENKFVNRSQHKELYFFNNLENYQQGERWYRSFFPLSSSLPTCDGTANYFESPEAPERLKIHYPNAKIVVLLRNPIDRAFSHYKMAVKSGFEKLSFEESMRREEERLRYEQEYRKDSHPYIYQRLAYRSKGVYAGQLKRWFDVFPQEQIHVVISEELFRNPEAECKKVLSFLGIQSKPTIALKQANIGSSEEMLDKTRDQLARFYSPHNEELEQLIGKTLNWK